MNLREEIAYGNLLAGQYQLQQLIGLLVFHKWQMDQVEYEMGCTVVALGTFGAFQFPEVFHIDEISRIVQLLQRFLSLL